MIAIDTVEVDCREDALVHVIQTRAHCRIGLDRLGKWFAEVEVVIELRARFLIEAFSGRVHTMDRAPIGHHEPAIAPVPF